MNNCVTHNLVKFYMVIHVLRYLLKLTSHPSQEEACVDHCPKPADQSGFLELCRCGDCEWAGLGAFLEEHLIEAFLKHVLSHLNKNNKIVTSQVTMATKGFVTYTESKVKQKHLSPIQV